MANRRTAKAPGFKAHREHAGWAIVEFDAIADAEAARLSTNGKKWKGTALDVTFKASNAQESSPSSSNALFCQGIYEASPKEFSAVFQRYEGFQHARLCECSLSSPAPLLTKTCKSLMARGDICHMVRSFLTVLKQRNALLSNFAPTLRRLAMVHYL